MTKIFAFALFAFVFGENGVQPPVSIPSRHRPPALSLLDDAREATLYTLDALWRLLTESSDVNHSSVDGLTLLKGFEKIHLNITRANEFIDSADFNLFASSWSYALVDGQITKINAFYETFVLFEKENLHKTPIPQDAWTNLARAYLQTSDFGVERSLDKIHRYVVTGTESENLFKTVEKEMRSNICNLRQSPHQVLYNLYNIVALADLKANTIIQFSYMLLQLYDKGNFTVEAQIARSTYEERAKEKIEVARTALAQADRSMYRCDPKQHVEGVTYTKLTKLLQGYIENEVNLNPYGTCRENCQYYSFTEYNGCFKNKFCAQQPQCRGHVVECRYVDSDMNICTSSNPERRYEWVEYENGQVLGSKGVCERKNLFKVDSWWRYLFWHCSYCLCLCDDNYRNSDRYFNLRDVVSDIKDNKIVTGVRLIKHNQIIHMQIQQGILGPRGIVEKNSFSWKPVDNYTIESDNTENGVDYHTMNWLERSFDIDEVIGPLDQIVTGVRFRKIGGHLNLEVRFTPFKFSTGEVYSEDYSYWMGNDNTEAVFEHPRSEIVLTNPDIPIRNGPHTLNSNHNQYVQFQSTSFETDAAQSTVPFIDSQALTSQGFPLSGIGFVLRGKLGSGGFLAPKLISFNFTSHLIF